MKKFISTFATVVLLTGMSFAQDNKNKTGNIPANSKTVLKPAPKTATPNFKPGTGTLKPNEQKGPAPGSAQTK